MILLLFNWMLWLLISNAVNRSAGVVERVESICMALIPNVMIRIFNKENKDDLVEFEMTNLLNVREKLNYFMNKFYSLI